MSDNLVPAAVLVPLFLGPEGTSPLRLTTRSGQLPLPSGTHVLLTVRTQEVEHHKGQISFPGGAAEPGDRSLEDTALRETQEEIGLKRDAVEVVATLPDLPTVRSNFRVHPYVGIIRERPVFLPNPEEIGEIILVSLEHLLDPRNSMLETLERDGARYQMRTYLFGQHRIWGVTGMILQTLLEKFITRC